MASEWDGGLTKESYYYRVERTAERGRGIQNRRYRRGGSTAEEEVQKRRRYRREGATEEEAVQLKRYRGGAGGMQAAAGYPIGRPGLP